MRATDAHAVPTPADAGAMRALLLLLAAALVLTPAAGTKESPTEGDFCGPSKCVTIKGRRVVAALKPYDKPTQEPPPPSPYFTVGPPDRMFPGIAYYVPAAGMLATVVPGRTLTDEDTVVWTRVDPAMRRLLARRTRGIVPFAPAITSVRVGDRVLTGAVAASYERLWRVPGRPVREPRPATWLEVDFRSERLSPWTLERAELLYEPRANVLERGRVLLRLPASLAEDVEAGRRLG